MVEIDRLYLESGLPYKLNSTVSVRHPLLRDILGLGRNGESIYWEYVGRILADPYQNMVWLDDNGIDYEDVDCFDVFCLQWKYLSNIYSQNKTAFDQSGFNPLIPIAAALDFFLGENHAYRLSSSGSNDTYIEDPFVNNFSINREEYLAFSTFVQKINGISFEGRIKPRDKTAKRILIEDMRDEINRKKNKPQTAGTDESSSFLGNMVASVLHGGNGAINTFNFTGAPIFSIVSAYKVLHKKENIDHILTGVYSGSVKSDALKNTNMDWAT